jgi:hypothetical protein
VTWPDRPAGLVVPCECGALAGEVLVLCASAGDASAKASAAPLENSLKVGCVTVNASCGYTSDSHNVKCTPRTAVAVERGRLGGIAGRVAGERNAG